MPYPPTMPKKYAPPPTPTVTDFDPGDAIVLQRPHLWSGCVGVIVSVKDHLHLVKIKGRDGDFHTEAKAENMRYDL